MKKIKLNLILLIALVPLLTFCGGVRDALEGKKRSEQSDEFLVKKKNPLQMPPDMNKLPLPGDDLEVSSQSNNKEVKDLLKINWNKSALEVHNLIRGLSPYVDKYTMLSDVSICPSAWFFLNNKRVKIYKASLTDKINQNSTIDTNNKTYLNINFEDKALSIEIIQMEGKKSMEIKQFLQGRKINDKDFIN